ncbi:MAG: hypothetical protein O2958_13130 [Gemmatimonadetes bacterium]|nr:hypothetical protein [Gemmatimonadota bacterium]MDA1104287.1 hypothetical protein [Gemmatimonadota bacterium]
MRTSKTKIACTLTLVLFTASCAASSAGSADGDEAASASGGGSVLTGEAVLATHESDLYRALQRLRPSWLRPRGQAATNTRTEVTLFVDGVPRGTARDLGTIPLTAVVDIRFLSASEAGFAFGTLAGNGGTLVVRTRR